MTSQKLAEELPFGHLPNSVQNIPPRIGSGSDANSAVNFPMDPNRNIIPAPYCTTRLLPTCKRSMYETLTHRFYGFEFLGRTMSRIRYLGDAKYANIRRGGSGAIACS